MTAPAPGRWEAPKCCLAGGGLPRRQVRKRLLAHVGQAATPPPVHEKGRLPPPTEATPCVSPPFVGSRCEGFPLRYYLYRDRLLKKGARWLHQHAPPPLPFRLGFSCLADYDHLECGLSRLFDPINGRPSILGDYNSASPIEFRVSDTIPFSSATVTTKTLSESTSYVAAAGSSAPSNLSVSLSGTSSTLKVIFRSRRIVLHFGSGIYVDRYVVCDL